MDATSFNPGVEEYDSGNCSRDIPGNTGTEGGRRPGSKRKKYAAKACQDCKRRKVRCSGEDVCQQCSSRDMRCCYSPPPPQQQQAYLNAHEQARSDPPHSNSGQASLSQTRDGEESMPFTFVPPLQSGSQDGQSSLSTHAPVTLPESRDGQSFQGSVASSHPQGPPSSSPQIVLATQSDPRVDGLCDRVQTLERMLSHVLKSSKVTEETSPGANFQLPVRLGASDQDDLDTNQFAVRVAVPDDLSLSSQVASMSALLSRPSSPKPGSGKPKVKAEVVVELPDASTLQHRLDVYFRDMDNYFPFLDREDTESHIYRVIRRLGYSPYNLMLVVPMEDLSIVALACIMLALAECLDARNAASNGSTKPGWDLYLLSCRAIHQCSHSKWLDLHVVSSQCLAAAYLMHCEILNAASEAISDAWKLAVSIRLNNRRTWPPSDQKGTFQKQTLWWIIYFLDRQISRRSGTAYHIRDTEYDVDDFASGASIDDSDLALQRDRHSSTTRSYLQALITSARLWGHVWDTFFAVGATKKGDWMEVEITDARILNTRRQLSKQMTWNSNEFTNYSPSEQDEPQIRRRLQLFTRLELLRMLIRQSPVRQSVFDPETAHFCARLSREVIKAHYLYILRFPDARATGYFTTSSIVECIYQLAPVLQYSKDQNEHVACMAAFNQAQGILISLSAHNIVARKALKALNGIARKWGSSNMASGGGGDVGSCQEETSPINAINFDAQVNEFHGDNSKIGGEGLGFDLSEWMNTSMGTLHGNEVDFGLPPIYGGPHSRSIHFNDS